MDWSITLELPIEKSALQSNTDLRSLSVINRSFVLLTAIICTVGSAGQLCAQKTITNPAAAEPSLAVPQKPTMQVPSSKPVVLVQAADADEVQKMASRLRTQELLPATTKAWISIPDAKDMSDRFDRSQFGELAKNKTLKPFADSIKSQVKDWIDQQNVRLNLDVDQLKGVSSGEICFAGVLQEDGKHGVVFLMDVTDTRDKAIKLSDRISKKLIARGATKKLVPIQGVDCTQLTLDKPKLFRTPRKTFHAIVDVKGDNKSSWMLVSNNESVFRDVLRRLTFPDRIQAVETLTAQKAFKAVMAQTKSEGFNSQIRWFVDPFGYIKLAQKIRDEESPNNVPRDDLAKKLAEAGFDAFRGIGGQVSLMTGEHEVVHRTFVYADKVKVGQKKVFDLFDFNVNKNLPHTLPRWVPDEASSIITGDWNIQKAFGAVGHFWDANTKPGSWKRLLIDLKNDPQLRFDMADVVSQVNNRFVVVSATERPIGPKSERVVVSVRLKSRFQDVFDNISRVNPDARIIKVGKWKFIEIDSTVEDDDSEIPKIEGLDDLDLDDPEEYEEEEEEEERFELFEKRYITVAPIPGDKSGGAELLICNDKNYLKKILARRKSDAETSSDFVRVKVSLAGLTDATKVAWRQFGRLDKGLETNYEMMRRGQMASSQTMLARIVNRIFDKQAAENARLQGKEFDKDAVRKQELDGATLPKDFSKSIAPYLGYTGSVIELTDGGWRITGVILGRGVKTATAKMPEKADPLKLDPIDQEVVTPVAKGTDQ